MKIIKEYWFLIVFILGLIGSGAIWIATIDSRTFDTTEQKVEIIKDYKESPSAEQKQRAYFQDSINTADAIKTRAKRLKAELKRDSIRGVQDSIILDVVQRNADQIYQIKNQLKESRNNN